MLWSTRDRKLRQIVRPSDDVSRRRSAGRAKPEQGLKRRHGCLSPVMAKDEFVKVDLQLMAADAVVRSDQPLLKIPDGAVGQRHCRRDPLSQGRPAGLHARDMAVARLSQAGELLQAVGEDRRARRDVLRDEGEQGGRFEVGMTAMRVVAPRALPTVPSGQRKGPRLTAARTSKPVRPPAGLQILPARCLVGELALELAQAGRKSRRGHSVHYP